MIRRRRREVVCQQLVELVTDYLEGALHPRDRAAVEAHLAQCGHCTGYVEQVRRMLELTAQRATTESVPADVMDVLVRRYREAR